MLHADKSIQARVAAAPKRLCEAPRCGKWSRSGLNPYCTNHRKKLHFHGSVHGRSIARKEVGPWEAEVESAINHLYEIPLSFRTVREHVITRELTNAGRYVDRWMKTAEACWPCTARAEIARLAGAGVSPQTLVLRFLGIVHLSRNTSRVLGTAPEIRCAVGRSILRSARLPKYHNSKRPVQLPVKDVRAVGELMVERFGRLAFYISMLCKDYRREAQHIAETPVETEASIVTK